MLISVYPRQMTNHLGCVVGVIVEASVSTSPREGYDTEKIAALERDLGKFVEERLLDAMRTNREAK